MNTQSRRQFLSNSGSAISGSWLSLNMPLVLAAAQTACSRHEAGVSWQNLTPGEAAGFAAVADQIIPPDDTPGAADTGVVYFLDEVLNGFMAGAAAMLREGLAALDQSTREAHPGIENFAALDFDNQTALLESIEVSPMFQTMMMITRLGMFALPEYGGNKDHSGWRLIGFEHQHAWQPPFGHYDEIYEGGEVDRGES
jgi:gluconate 2-dehydrogenase gamma chain